MTGLDQDAGRALRDKFRAASTALAAEFAAHVAGGRHTYEKGLRNEQVLIDFLRKHLPPKYGVSRGEIVDSQGGVARQADVVVYDAHHAPLFQQGETSKVFAAESVYALIELKPNLTRTTLAEAVEAVRSAKALDRSAVVTAHGGHTRHSGPAGNPPMFGAIFALKATDPTKLVPALAEIHDKLPAEQRPDAVCVLGSTLVYHFGREQADDGRLTDWAPAVLAPGTSLGYYASKQDTLLYFYLFLLYQLSWRELFPPDFTRYIAELRQPPARVYRAGMVIPPDPHPRRRRPT